MLTVKEVFYTLQGEGFHAGRPAVFCRFSLCNLWTGREKDRHRAICKFCDTDFVGTDGVNGGKYELEELADLIDSVWGAGDDYKMVVLTGGEPAIQVTWELVSALQYRGFYVAIETNGTLLIPEHIDWVCVSPKAGSKIVRNWGDELKVVYPQDFDLEELEKWVFFHRWLSPMDGPDIQQNTKLAVDYCLQHPQWNLSTQTHKQIGIA